MKKRSVFVIVSSLAFCIVIGLSLFLILQTGIIPNMKVERNQITVEKKELLRFDLNSKTHNINELVLYMKEKFSYLYDREMIERPEDMYVNDFIIDFKKDENGYYIAEMFLMLYFTQDNRLYQQSFTLKKNIVASYIDKDVTVGEEYTTSVDAFFQKLDNTDFSYFTKLLPKGEYYHLEYLGDTHTFHKNALPSRRYLINTNGVMSGDIPEDIEIGDMVPVLYLFSAKEISPGQYNAETEDSLGIYFNN